MRGRLEVAHTKLAASRAFWLTAYSTQTHDMLFDAHTRAFQALGGIPKHGVYDNMKSAVDKVGTGGARAVNALFQAVCSPYRASHEALKSGQLNGAAAAVEKLIEDSQREAIRQLEPARTEG